MAYLLTKLCSSGALPFAGHLLVYDEYIDLRLTEQSSTIMQQLELGRNTFYLATIHHAENTDEPGRMDNILSAFSQIDLPVILPMHPRTRNALNKKSAKISANVRVIEPESYLDMLILEKNSRLI
jgi:UDP-GlcNAc3NAcA epimerase